MDVLYQAVVNTMRDPLNVRDSPEASGRKIGELGWWQKHVYRSTTAANVYTPDQYAAGWELVR